MLKSFAIEIRLQEQYLKFKRGLLKVHKNNLTQLQFALNTRHLSFSLILIYPRFYLKTITNKHYENLKQH